MDKQKPFNNFIKQYKHTHKCSICGESADCCLEFHHINPKIKLFSLRRVNEHKYTKQQLIDECNKTILLCANCHRKLHHNLLPSSINYKWLMEHKVNIQNYE